jgi:hypothetical protein
MYVDNCYPGFKYAHNIIGSSPAAVAAAMCYNTQVGADALVLLCAELLHQSGWYIISLWLFSIRL